jgi:hypothetical protein
MRAPCRVFDRPGRISSSDLVYEGGMTFTPRLWSDDRQRTRPRLVNVCQGADESRERGSASGRRCERAQGMTLERQTVIVILQSAVPYRPRGYQERTNDAHQNHLLHRRRRAEDGLKSLHVV